MAKKVSLLNRKVIQKDSAQLSIGQEKKDILMALQLQELSDHISKVGHFIELPIDMVKPDKNQPRKTFKNIDTLSDSIKENGVIQPIIVTTKKDNGYHYIIAGERRYLASIQAGLTTIPCLIRDVESDANIILLQLLENDQREGVSPFEEADALRELIENKQVKKSEVAKALGRDSSWISMRLKIADANESIRELSNKGIIEDVRTLYELKKFAEEIPKGADEFIKKALDSKITGSYRAAILKYRDAWNKNKVVLENANFDIITISKVDKDNGLLKITGSKGGSRSHTYTFEMTENLKKTLFEALVK